MDFFFLAGYENRHMDPDPARQWMCPIYDGMTQDDVGDEFPFLASREKWIEFVELQANAGRSSILAIMLRPMEGYPADKDLRTQYEWAKAWNKKRSRELCLNAA